MPDFWRSSGYRLLTVTESGRLAIADAFLRSFLARPELVEAVAEDLSGVALVELAGRVRATNGPLLDAGGPAD